MRSTCATTSACSGTLKLRSMGCEKTYQVSTEDGFRLTAHYVRWADGKWGLVDLGSNLEHVPVKLVRELMVLIDKENK